MQTYGHSRTKELGLHLVNVLIRTVFILDHRIYRKSKSLYDLMPSRIVVARLDQLGDAILSTAACAALRKQFPHAHITALVASWAADVFRHNEDISDVYVVDCPWWMSARGMHVTMRHWWLLVSTIRRLRSDKVDLFIDLRGDVRNIVMFGGFGGARHLLSYDRTGANYLLSGAMKCDENRHELMKNLDLIGQLGCTYMEVRAKLPVSLEDRERVRILLREAGIECADRYILVPTRSARS